MPDINIMDVVGAGTAAAGLVIANAIILSMISARFSSTFDRYRALTSELREGPDQEARRKSLAEQVCLFCRRCSLLRRASLCLLSGELAMLLTIVLVSASVALPAITALKLATGASAVLGLGLSAAGVALDLAEIWLSRVVIDSELRDLRHLLRAPYGGPTEDGVA